MVKFNGCQAYSPYGEINRIDAVLEVSRNKKNRSKPGSSQAFGWPPCSDHSVVINYLHVFPTSISPTEADAPPVVNSNAVLAGTGLHAPRQTGQLLQMGCNGESKIMQSMNCSAFYS